MESKETQNGCDHGGAFPNAMPMRAEPPHEIDGSRSGAAHNLALVDLPQSPAEQKRSSCGRYNRSWEDLSMLTVLTRAHEIVFGGVTKETLKGIELPALLFH